MSAAYAGRMAVPTPEEFEAAGLYDPDDDTIRGRLELLRWLWSEGFTIAEMQNAQANADLNAMAGDRWILPAERHPRAEAIERTGLEADVFDAFTTALGIVRIQGAPEGEVGYTDGEIELLSLIGPLGDIFSRDESLAFFRVIASSMARIAEAAVSMFLTDVESTYMREGRTELELATAARSALTLTDGMGERLDPLKLGEGPFPLPVGQPAGHT